MSICTFIWYIGFFFFKQKTAYEMRISDWSSDVCSSDLRGLHAVVQQLARHAADRLEGGDVAAQHRRQVLMGDEPRPDQAAVPQHQREQPHYPRPVRLVGEHHRELREVEIGRAAGRERVWQYV